MKNASNTILFSRFVTKSGDQAWEFSLPITLLLLFPERTQFVILIYLASKLATVLILPKLASVVDIWPRMKTAVFGTIIQFFGVSLVAAFIAVYTLHFFNKSLHNFYIDIAFFSAIWLGTLSASLGSSIMDIAVGNDWIPGLIPSDNLAKVNSRMRQIDLFTEVSAPVAAGALLLFKLPILPVAGFLIVASWNAFSFIPEALLLQKALRQNDVLKTQKTLRIESKTNLWNMLSQGWTQFKTQKAAPAMFAYSLLWLSALSPHGILLTTFLKSDWKISEFSLALFRGAGAIFGLSATFLFPLAHRKFGLIKASSGFILFQAGVLLAALPLFFFKALSGWAFLIFVLLSRIGLYGFSLGELEIRQKYIPENFRGQINGVASSLNSCATLILFGLGSMFATAEGFGILTLVSVASVTLASVVFWKWVTGLNSHAPKDF